MMSRRRTLNVCLFGALASSLFALPAAAQDTDSEEDVRPEMKEMLEDDEGSEARGIVVSDNFPGEDDEEPAGWTVEFFGYLRTQYTAIQDDPNLEEFGRNDGFIIADARFGFLGYLDNGLGFELEVDAGVPRPTEEANTAIGEVVTRLRDGYVFYQPHPLFRASAGQFKVPFDIEELLSTANILFVERSVGSRGVEGVEGPNREGLSVGRQVGVRIDSDPFFFVTEDDGPGVSYALAATNGQSANRSLNDNDQAAFYGRVNLHWGEIARLGGGAYYNDRTIGELPDLIGETQTGWTADLTVAAAGFSLLANVVQVEFEPPEEVGAEPARTGLSYQAQVAYEEPFFGLQPAYRFAYLDPDTDREGAEAGIRFESLTYHTVGLNYNAKTYPLRLMLNYTITAEEQLEIDNDRFDALVQVEW
ncbi:porin [Persicimonas caeni]|nr:porin [Persicimonas caeni]